MASNDYTTPDLASVLATLAAYAPPVSSATQQPQISSNPYVPQDRSNQLNQLEELEDGEYDPSDFVPTPCTLTTHQTPVQQRQQPHLQPVPNLLSQTPHQPPSHSNLQPLSQPIHPLQVPKPSPVDPTTLLTWPSALRYVTKTVAPNPRAMGRIRELINSQHTHERQWWAGRESLIKKQKERVEGRAKIDNVLKAVGGNINTLSNGPTAEEDTNEVLLYDKKVHRACTEMFRAINTELRNLGIPFFGISADMIVPDKSNEASESEDNTSKRKGRVSEKELGALQNRMVELLKDLCKD